MRVFHGSTTEVPFPDVAHSHRHLDFGPGFYLTSFEVQATRWARRKALRQRTGGIVNAYELAADLSGFSVLRFGAGDEAAWVKFVCRCRQGGADFRGFDAIMGPVADDRVYAAVDMYAKGLWNIDQTLAALKHYSLNDQICLLSQRLVDQRLSFLNSYEVGI
jgi:hypothetical protein